MPVFERELQIRTCDFIERTYGKGAICRVKHGTAYAVAGDPDVYGCLKHLGGRMYALECKTETGILSSIQRHRLKQFATAGALVGAVQSLEQVARILRTGISEV